jgi:hypothetical protein
MWGCQLDKSYPEYDPVVDSYEDGNGLLGSIKAGNLLSH